MQLSVPVSVGEIIDKITILRIKQRKIADAGKKQDIARELMGLKAACHQARVDLETPLVAQLETINEKLWDIEDAIREKERQGEFDDGFIELARSVYKTNDERFAAKAQINEETGSTIREVKSYKPY